MPYFFLSYANADGDGYLDAFYRDLSEAVRSRTGLRAEDIGFRDQTTLPVGVNWMSELATALASARVFVAMCSPSYFASDMCGREWEMFAELAQQRSPGTGVVPANLLPIIWIPATTMPDIARRLQYSHEDLGQVYRREGLQFLARLRRYRDDYQMFVTRLAERIVAVGESRPPRPPASVPRLEDVPSAFATEPPAAAGAAGGAGGGAGETVVRPQRRNAHVVHRVPPAVPPGGPLHVHIVVVAAPNHRIGHVRRDTQYYGRTAYEWAPYKPHFPQRVCVFAQNVASTNDLTSALATAESSIVDLLAEAKERNELVVLIVDVWTTKLPPYDSVLNEYDELNVPTSAVVVPWNETDGEIRERADELREDLRRAFPNNTARGDDVFRSAIPTHETLKVALEEVLARMQSRIFRAGAVRRRAGGERIIDRPVLARPDVPPDVPPEIRPDARPDEGAVL